jgi:hypothetical protein
MQFPLHLPGASMWLFVPTSMWPSLTVPRWLTTASSPVYVPSTVSPLAGTCNVLQASAAHLSGSTSTVETLIRLWKRRFRLALKVMERTLEQIPNQDRKVDQLAQRARASS